MPERKDISRQQILWHICQFSLGIEIGGQPYAGLSDMRFRHNKLPSVGSLVAMQSMRSPRWYLAWVLGVSAGVNEFCTVYTLESVETGEVGDWSNVGMLEYDPRQTREHPEWRWTDDQWKFKKSWDRLCYKERDAYIVLPLMPVFDGDRVELGTRIRHGWGAPPPSKWFDKWADVTDADMLAFYDESVAADEAARTKPATSAG